MNVTQNINRWDQLEQDWLVSKHVFCSSNKQPDFLLFQNIRKVGLRGLFIFVDGIARVLVMVNKAFDYVVKQLGRQFICYAGVQD